MQAIYTAIWQHECARCTGAPVVGLVSPAGHVVNTDLCGPCFFGDKTMADPDLWNEPREATE